MERIVLALALITLVLIYWYYLHRSCNHPDQRPEAYPLEEIISLPPRAN